MPSRTQTERIEAVEKEALRQGFQLQNLEDRSRSDIAILRAEIRRLEDRLLEVSPRLATSEQRCSQLEKLVEEGRTRRWQVWLAVLAAILSAVIALIVALVKK